MIEMIDIYLKPLLQKNVKFWLKNKSLKNGKLVFYKISGNYLVITLLNEKKRETFEIPYPFSVFKEKEKTVLDYTLEALSEKDFYLLISLKSVNRVKNCKFYDNMLYIEEY